MSKSTTRDDLAAIEPWLAGLMAPLEPAQRIMLARRVGALMRRANAARVSANLDPEGEAMTPRKHGRASKGQTPIHQRGKRGMMFRRIELARNMVVIPGLDQVALTFRPRVIKTAEVHHFGEVAPVNPRIRNSIRVRYAERRLLGFGLADSDAILGEVMAHLYP